MPGPHRGTGAGKGRKPAKPTTGGHPRRAWHIGNDHFCPSFCLQLSIRTQCHCAILGPPAWPHHPRQPFPLHEFPLVSPLPLCIVHSWATAALGGQSEDISAPTQAHGHVDSSVILTMTARVSCLVFFQALLEASPISFPEPPTEYSYHS